MKLVSFNLEEALANPERVVCNGFIAGVKLVKWQYHEDVQKEGFEYPIGTWFDVNGAKVYSANSVNGKSIRGFDFNLMLKVKKKTIPFDETLLGKEGVRVFDKECGLEFDFKYKSSVLEKPYVFEAYIGFDRAVLVNYSLQEIKERGFVIEIDE